MHQTHTYATLEVSNSTFDDIRDRIRALGPDYWYRYTDCNKMDAEPKVLHMAGEVAFVREDK